jgi:hypothetical protein
MARPPAVPPEEKTRLVLAILAGEMTIAEAARRAKVGMHGVCARLANLDKESVVAQCDLRPDDAPGMVACLGNAWPPWGDVGVVAAQQAARWARIAKLGP